MQKGNKTIMNTSEYSHSSEKIDILVLVQKLLKGLFQMPYDGLSSFTNNLMILCCHIVLLANASGTSAAGIYQLMVGIEDKNILIEVMIGVCDYIGFIYIFVCFRLKIADLKNVLRDINNFLEFCDPSVIRDAEVEVNFYTKCFTFYFFSGLFLNGLVPMLNIQSCRERQLSDFYRKHDPCGLPVRNLYPFDATIPINFLFVSLIELFTCVVVCFGILGITMSLIGFLIHIIAQIRNCKKFILNIFNDNDYLKDENNSETRRKITFCIKYHQAIISYTDRVYDIFNLLLIVHISLTSIIFGVILYLIVSVENYMDKLRYCLHLAGWIALLFITCFYGQRIITESSTIADAAYESYWYDGPPEMQRKIKFIILRGQKPLRLRAASVGVISLETFVAVLKTAYSFFALLITISD